MFKAIKRRVDKVLDTTPRESLRTTGQVTRKVAHATAHTSLADLGTAAKDKAKGMIPGRKKKAPIADLGDLDPKAVADFFKPKS